MSRALASSVLTITGSMPLPATIKGGKTAKKGSTRPSVKPTYVANPSLKPNKTAISKLRKDQLQVELECRGLDVAGNKDVLVARLLRALTVPVEAVVAPKLPSLDIVAEPALVPVEETIPVEEAIPVEQPAAEVAVQNTESALLLEVQLLQDEKVELETALQTARAMLEQIRETDEMEKTQLKECMMRISLLASTHDDDREELETAAAQLQAQLEAAQQESAELQEIQAQLGTSVSQVTLALQEKEGELAALRGQMLALRDMTAQVTSVELLPGQVILNLDPATKSPAYPVLMALAGGSMLAEAATWAWGAVRSSRPSEERKWVDAAGVAFAMAAATAMAIGAGHH